MLILQLHNDFYSNSFFKYSHLNGGCHNFDEFISIKYCRIVKIIIIMNMIYGAYIYQNTLELIFLAEYMVAFFSWR